MLQKGFEKVANYHENVHDIDIWPFHWVWGGAIDKYKSAKTIAVIIFLELRQYKNDSIQARKIPIF